MLLVSSRIGCRPAAPAEWSLNRPKRDPITDRAVSDKVAVAYDFVREPICSSVQFVEPRTTYTRPRAVPKYTSKDLDTLAMILDLGTSTYSRYHVL